MFKFVKVAQKAAAVSVQFFDPPKRLLSVRGYIYNASRGLPITILIERERKECEVMPYPSTYRKEMIPKMEAWLAERQAKDEYPSIAGLAVHLDVPHSTLELWGQDKEDNAHYHEEVGRVLARVRDYRLSWLERHGLDGSAQPQIAKLLLSAHHNINEKTAQDVTLGQDADRPFKVSVVVDI